MTIQPKPIGRRTVIGNISLSLDGRTTGPNGEYDMGWVAPHAVSDTSRAHLAAITAPTTTVLLGRKNYQGFGYYWPPVAEDPQADPRDREFSRWLNAVEKIVFSTTLTEPTWQHSRIVNSDPVAFVADLRQTQGGDILVMSSSSLIRALLRADLLDRLSITLCPELVGGGARLLDDGFPALSWALTQNTATESGALCLHYDRIRQEK